jgi:protein SCO1/2
MNRREASLLGLHNWLGCVAAFPISLKRGYPVKVKFNRLLSAPMVLALLLAGSWSGAQQINPAAKSAEGYVQQATTPGPEVSKEALYFTDVVLINQDGERMRLYSDLLRGKVVIVNTIFTTCTGICPVMSRTYARLQEWLGDRLGKDVHLISISVDPKYDTPARLKEFGESYGARPGWYLLTGEKENVDTALLKLGHYVKNKEEHKALMIIGNEPAKLWKKQFALVQPEQIIQVVDSVLNHEKPGS